MAKKDAKKDNIKRRKKALAPSHTKSYYRFSKDFPSVTDSEGYRDNEVFVNSPAKKASMRRRLISVFVSVFAVTYILTMLSFAVSRLPVNEKAEAATGDNQAVTVLSGYNAAYLSGEALSFSSVESIINEFKIYGVDTVVIDFKDAEGYFYFKPSISVSADALYKASENAMSVVKQFRDADIDVFAKVACFADDIYARNNQTQAAYVMTSPESGSYEQIKTMWYNTGSDSHAWLNPYSNEVLYYIRTVVTDIAALNVDGIIFDYAALPMSADTDNTVFEGESDSEKNVREQMASFISTLNTTYVSCSTGVSIPRDVMLSALAESEIPEVVYSDCDFIVPDARLSLMPDDTILGNMKYTKPAVSPSEFISQYVAGIYALLASDETVADVEVMPILEASDSSNIQIDAVASSGGKSYLVFSNEMTYTDEHFN